MYETHSLPNSRNGKVSAQVIQTPIQLMGTCRHHGSINTTGCRVAVAFSRALPVVCRNSLREMIGERDLSERGSNWCDSDSKVRQRLLDMGKNITAINASRRAAFSDVRCAFVCHFHSSLPSFPHSLALALPVPSPLSPLYSALGLQELFSQDHGLNIASPPGGIRRRMPRHGLTGKHCAQRVSRHHLGLGK
jgi:hypothetical protein